MMFGYPIPTDDSTQFDSQTACQIYLHTHDSDAVVDAFQTGVFAQVTRNCINMSLR
jgi:hypothetical protein